MFLEQYLFPYEGNEEDNQNCGDLVGGMEFT